MDFQTLTRRELQSLCKLNKIPANITNVAMAEALQSLEIVVGIEEFMNVTQSETADLVESVETVEASQTRCRTSTRQKVKPTETENLQSTVTRTTRRGSKQPPKEVEESKNDMLKTPAVSRTSRKVSVTTALRNVNNQLSECETEAKEEVLVENKYSTRRSTRLTGKKSAAPASRVKKGVEKAVKIDSFLDQGNSNAEVEDICEAFEKLDVVVIEEEVNSLKQDSDETSNSFVDNLEISEVKNDEVKPESDGISSPSEEVAHKSGVEDEDCDEVSNQKQDLEDDLNNSEVKNDISSPCEDENLVQKLDLGDNLMSAMKEQIPVIVQEEHYDADDTSCEEHYDETKENNLVMVQEEISDCLLESGVDAELEHEDTEMDNEVAETNEIITKEMKEMAENTVDEIVDAIPTIDSTMTEEVEDLKPEIFTENNVNEKSDADADSGLTESPLISSDVSGHPTHVTPIKKATPFKSMTEEVEDHKPEFFTENNVTEKSDADSAPIESPLILSDVTGHPTIKKATPFKNMTEEVEDNKPEFFTENNVTEKSDADPLILSHVTGHPTHVTDDKENIVVDGKNGKKEKDENEKKSLNDTSIRQLKKQLKALTLKSLNSKEEGDAAGTKRPALQAVCENQMVVGGETGIKI